MSPEQAPDDIDQQPAEPLPGQLDIFGNEVPVDQQDGA